MKIKPEIPNIIQKYVETLEPTDIEKPTRLYFPEVLRQNIRFIADLPVTTYLAHKATKTKAFLEVAKEEGIRIDVASTQELQNALQTGISPQRIEATGPKNEEFLKAAINNNVLISIDNLKELTYIKETEQPVNVLIRIANPREEEVLFSKTKFGILKKNLPRVKELTKGTPITVKGFHYHGDGMSTSMKGKIISYFLSQIEKHFPDATIINMGGAFTEKQLRQPRKWSSLIQKLTEELKEGKTTTWSQKPYGIQKGSKNNVVGGDQALIPSKDKTLRDQLTSLLQTKTINNTSLQNILHDTDITLSIEPGHALLYNTGIAVFPVTSTKEILGGNLTIVDGNTFMISKQMREPYADPDLLTYNDKTKKYTTFIGGLLCRDDDIFMTRSITFEAKPQRGDLIVFYNQGSYEAYQEGTPQSHTLPATKTI